ncbi:hypothetical protein ACHQM5_029145 [Ranunculus cassubicifolius]
MAMKQGKTMSSVLYTHVEEESEMVGSPRETKFNVSRTRTRATYAGSQVMSKGGNGADKVGVAKISKEIVVDINQSAEAFINRFRQQLRIERLDSIENYKNILERGL